MFDEGITKLFKLSIDAGWWLYCVNLNTILPYNTMVYYELCSSHNVFQIFIEVGFQLFGEI